jgi:hypothetical protein
MGNDDNETLALLNEYRIEEYDRQEELIETFQPSGEDVVEKKHGNRKESENAVTALYESQGFFVGNINRKWDNALYRAVSEMPDAIKSNITQAVNDTQQTDLEIDGVFGLLTIDGIPDLIVCDSKDASNYKFIEVKKGYGEPLRQSQKDWIDQFPRLPVHIARVFREVASDNNSQKPAQADTESLSERFTSARRKYNQRPATGTTSENDGEASTVTLAHYGLLEATGYDTGVIKSLNEKVLAATIAAFRDESSEQVQTYREKDVPELKTELEKEFSHRFGSNGDKPVEVTGSVGRLAPSICAGLSALNRANPLASTQRHLDKKVK